MYKSILLFITVFLSYSTLQADSMEAEESSSLSIRHQVSASYGFLALPALFQGLADVFIEENNGLTYNDKSSIMGPINFQYQYLLTENLSMGLDVGIIVYEKEYKRGNDQIVNMKNVYYSFMPSAYYKWYESGKFNISASVAAGMVIHSQSDKVKTESKEYFAFQASPVVLSYGSIFKGFIDLGVGYRGLASMGLSFSF